jgi:hypothetical protein
LEGHLEIAMLHGFTGYAVTITRRWDWEIELTPHLERRMEDRDFGTGKWPCDSVRTTMAPMIPASALTPFPTSP